MPAVVARLLLVQGSPARQAYFGAKPMADVISAGSIFGCSTRSEIVLPDPPRHRLTLADLAPKAAAAFS